MSTDDVHRVLNSSKLLTKFCSRRKFMTISQCGQTDTSRNSSCSTEKEI